MVTELVNISSRSSKARSPAATVDRARLACLELSGSAPSGLEHCLRVLAPQCDVDVRRHQLHREAAPADLFSGDDAGGGTTKRDLLRQGGNNLPRHVAASQ